MPTSHATLKRFHVPSLARNFTAYLEFSFILFFLILYQLIQIFTYACPFCSHNFIHIQFVLVRISPN